LADIEAQLVRDPLHDLIEFDAGQFEHMLWRVIRTPPFQRLRRIRQLGFSEFVFPGATHTPGLPLASACFTSRAS
jgi:HD superfamily phosphohydrolase